MKKVLIALPLVFGVTFAAADNVGGCGLGTKVWDGQTGVLPQILAVTTNATSGNQTFGITSGTLGCSQDGVVKSNWKTAMYIDGNRVTLARDVAAGQGEALAGLMAVMNVQAQDQAYLAAVLKAQFATVFASEQVGANMKAVLAADARLAAYAQAIAV